MSDERRRRRSGWARRAPAALALAAAATFLSPSSPTAAGGGAFRGVAAAEGMRVGVSAVGAPITNDVVDGASPIAQAAVDSTSGSSALASAAYPGDLVVTTPGLLAGVSGGQLSGVPPYPLIARAGSTTTSEQTVEGPGSTMRAVAADRKAEATARSGAAPAAEGGPAPAWSTSSTVEADDIGAVTSTAASEVTGVAIGPLALGRVTARSVVRRAPGGDPVRETAFEATGIAIGETAVALTPGGLVVAGTTTPVSATPLQAALDGAGIAVRPLAADTTTDGVVSAGLVVSRTQDLPTAISPVTVTYTFGRALAAVSPAALEPIEPIEVIAPFPEQSGPAGPAGGDSTDRVAAGDVVEAGLAAGGATGSVTGGTPAATGVSGAGTATGRDATSAGTGAATGTAERAEEAAGQGPVVGTALPVRRVGSRLFDLSAIYLLLVAAAATAAAVIQFVRHTGVRP